MNIFSHFRGLTPSQRWRLVPIFAFMLISSVLEVFGLGLLIPFFQFLSDPTSIESLPEFVQRGIAMLPGETTQETAMAMALCLVAVFIAKGIISILGHWLQTWTVYRLYSETAVRVLENHLNAPITFLSSRNSAEVIRVVANDTLAFFTTHIVPLLNLFAELIPLLAITIAMLIIDPVVTIVAAVCLGGFTGIVMTLMRRQIIYWGYRRRDAFADMMRWVSQGIGGIKEVQVLGAQPYITREYETATDSLARASVVHALANSSPRYILEALVVAVLVGFTALLQSGGDPPSIWMPRLVFFGAAAIRLAPAAIRSLNYVNQIRATHATSEAVLESLTEMPQHIAREPDDASPLPFTRELRFEDVVSRYPEAETPALNGLSLRVPFGSTVALVGPTGAGKTTAVDVLLGLIRPDSGAVYVDDVPITKQEHRWQKQLGYVPQFIYLADLTIAENVAFGVPDGEIDEEEIWRALEFAAIDDFIRTLPNGIHTRVGERGVMLSGGQRQRLGIARALYFRPRVLVMDEATSALDSETEQRISEATQRLHGTLTMVLIAHRLTTVRHADTIIILKDGRVEDSGTFDDLVERSELFRSLARGLDGVENGDLADPPDTAP